MANSDEKSSDVNQHRILIVDDAKNIRLTLSELIRELGYAVVTAESGRTALEVLTDHDAWLVLLDLRLPDLNGMEVLRRARALGSKATFVIITAHGTVAAATEAMKLGAVDFLQKPFEPAQVRELVNAIANREGSPIEAASVYGDLIDHAIRTIRAEQYASARLLVDRALHLDDSRPEAHNLLGVLHEVQGDRFQAQQCYREALSVDPTYEPARANLRHSVESGLEGSIILQEIKKNGIHQKR